MKKVVFMMSLLLTLGLFSACSNDGEMDIDTGGGLLIPDSTLIPDDGIVLNPITSAELFDMQNRENGIEFQGGPKARDIVSIFYFFNGQLPIGTRSVNFFVGSDKDECYVINSLQELKSIYCGEKELPELDFDNYTLVIGQRVMPTVFYPVQKQELEFSNHQCELKLHVPNFIKENTTNVPFYYWAIYPKFNTEGISVKFIKERDAIKTVDGIEGVLWHNPYNQLAVYKWRDPLYDIPLLYDYGGSLSDIYYPINLPDNYEIDQIDGTDVTFSGEVVEMTEDSREALQIDNTGRRYFFIYLTNIEEREVTIDDPYRGTAPFTITDMPGMVGYDWDNERWMISYVVNHTRVTDYYPKELSEEFQVPGLNVTISGNVYEDVSISRKHKEYKIELTKIEKAE